MSWIALIRAALEAWAAVPKMWDEYKKIRKDQEIARIDQLEMRFNAAVTAFGSGQTLEERDEALKKLGLSSRG